MEIFQADIQNRCGMGQRTAGYIIYPKRCDGFDIFDCHIAGAFGFCSAVNDADGLRHFRRAHVIQHDDICAGFDCFSYHIQSFRFDLDFADEGSIRLCCGNGFLYAACRADMVILQHYAVGKIIAVIRATADGYGIFFKHSHTGSGFSCIQKGCFCTRKQLCNGIRIGCDATHALQIIEGGAFCGKQNTDIPRHGCQKLPLFHSIPIGGMKGNFCFFIQKLKRPCEHIQTGNDAVLLAD